MGLRVLSVANAQKKVRMRMNSEIGIFDDLFSVHFPPCGFCFSLPAEQKTADVLKTMKIICNYHIEII